MADCARLSFLFGSSIRDWSALISRSFFDAVLVSTLVVFLALVPAAHLLLVLPAEISVGKRIAGAEKTRARARRAVGTTRARNVRGDGAGPGCGLGFKIARELKREVGVGGGFHCFCLRAVLLLFPFFFFNNLLDHNVLGKAHEVMPLIDIVIVSVNIVLSLWLFALAAVVG